MPQGESARYACATQRLDTSQSARSLLPRAVAQA